MRIGMSLPFMDASGAFLDAAAISERARMIEAAGLEGIWLGDHLPIPEATEVGRPDPFSYLLLAAQATSERIEIGTNIYGVPVRNPYDVAQRLFTLETLAPGRFTIGVGTGSSAREYELAGLDWDKRFGLMSERMATIRSLFTRPADHPPSQYSWAQMIGPPRFALGAWLSEPQLRLAVSEYDCWLGSARRGSLEQGWRYVLSEAIKRYRDLGGGRAIVSTVGIDLHAASAPLSEGGAFGLQCPPEEAAERLHLLAELGYDDVILNWTDRRSSIRPGPHLYDFTSEDLEEIRALVPRDDQDYRSTMPQRGPQARS